MKTVVAVIATGVMMCGISLAQDATAPQPNSATPPNSVSAQPAPPNSLRIAPGSVIPVQLTKSIDAKKVKTGDQVEAKVTQDLKSGNGMLVVPKDTKVVGHITQAQPRTKQQSESQIGISFDHAVLKNGGDVALPMSIQAIIAPPGSNPESNNGPAESASQPAPVPSTSGVPPGNTGGRSPEMGSGVPQGPSPSATASEAPANTQTATARRPSITGNTQGVVGISNLKLSTPNAAPSVVSSEKNNVKLESGTFMLLRVK
jgi:hypothetical protein